MNNKYDKIIQEKVNKFFSQCDWLLIKAQVKQESNFNPNAKSPVGASGLLQLMPKTFIGMGGNIDKIYEPEVNLEYGIRYLALQFARFAEIPDKNEKLKFALASYNGGRQYCNIAIKLAYHNEFNQIMNYNQLKNGQWQTWDYTKEFLKSDKCIVDGKRPDWKQIIDYVSKIFQYYKEYKNGQNNR